MLSIGDSSGSNEESYLGASCQPFPDVANSSTPNAFHLPPKHSLAPFGSVCIFFAAAEYATSVAYSEQLKIHTYLH